MNAMRRLRRWLGIGATLGLGIKSTAPRRGLLHGLLPLLMLGGLTLAAPAQFVFWTESNPDGTLTVYKTVGGWQGEGCSTGALTIPDTIDGRKVTSIGVFAFSGCTTLTSVTIPDSVTRIGDAAFFRCTDLTQIMIPDGVTRIGDRAFSECSRLTSVTIGNGVTSIGDGAFSGCTNLTSITIPASVTSIGDNAFSGCTGLNNVTIPDSVTSIGYGAFSGCTNLTSVTIPESVTRIGDYAFGGCTGLTSITVAPLNPAYRSVDGVLFNKDRTTLLCYPGGRAGAYTMPDSVTRIGEGAFSGCNGLTSITIPDSVTSIGASAFSLCNGLTSITIPDSVTSIEGGAFVGCAGMTRAVIGSGVRSIFNGAFAAPELRAAYFRGDQPPVHVGAFHLAVWSAPVTVYYLPGTIGWTSTFDFRTPAPWVLPQPTILDFGDRFGPSTNGFNFVISWATNVPVVVEASADIGGSWTPISTNTLTGGWVQFTDPDWAEQAARFYRVRGQ